MRLTREILIKIARDAAIQRVRISRRIISIYLTGSVLEEEPLLGGTTDIDLVIIHDDEPLQSREIIRLTDEVHLDISHYPQSLFRQPRHLRTDPWLGPFIYNKPLVFHDTQHWFDFTQAATGAQFFQPEYVIQRSSALAQLARQAWMELSFNTDENHPKRLTAFLQAVENAGNALASLTGSPITERRFFQQLPYNLQSLNQPDLIAELVHLFMPATSGWDTVWSEWLDSYKEAFRLVSSQAEVSPKLHPARQAYYLRAAAALWEENPTAAIWLLLRNWTTATEQLSSEAPERNGWRMAIQSLNLDENAFAQRLEKMDHFLDRVEETLDEWARKNGVSIIPEW